MNNKTFGTVVGIVIALALAMFAGLYMLGLAGSGPSSFDDGYNYDDAAYYPYDDSEYFDEAADYEDYNYYYDDGEEFYDDASFYFDEEGNAYDFYDTDPDLGAVAE